MSDKNVYADANATFPVRSQHYEQVMSLLATSDGNPSSIHTRGRDAKVALEHARTAVASMLGARSTDVVFTSGATESNNLLIQGVIWKAQKPGFLPEVIVSGFEHPSVMAVVALMAERQLCKVLIAPVVDYVVTTGAVMSLISDATVLVCVMHANNETGSINPVYEIADTVAKKNPSIHMHVDAVQALGKIDLSEYAASSIHSASLSAHKVGGLKGSGALYIKTGTKLGLVIAGGGQERFRRAGTENLPGIISFGVRCQELLGQQETFTKEMSAAKMQFIEGLKNIEGTEIHGQPAQTLPNTVNFHIDRVAGDDLLLNLDLCGVCASSGSACSSGVTRPSPVLLACNQSEWVALNSIRISFTDTITSSQVEHILSVLESVTSRVRR